MTLDLDKLAAKSKTGTLPKSTRGVTATPIPEAILTMVKDSYALDAGEGTLLSVPVGNKDSKDRDENVVAVTNVLRRAAASLDLGLTIRPGDYDDKSKTTPIVFRATDKRAVVRATKPTDIWTVDGKVEDAEGAPGARLATVPEARAIGYTFGELEDGTHGWFVPETDE